MDDIVFLMERKVVLVKMVSYVKVVFFVVVTNSKLASGVAWLKSAESLDRKLSTC